MLHLYIVVSVAFLIVGRREAAPTDLCTAKAVGSVRLGAVNATYCELCKCSEARGWICADVSQIQADCRTPECPSSEWEPDPASLCCMRCRRPQTCIVGELSHPCAGDPCLECTCQDVLGVAALVCTNASSDCLVLDCPEQETPPGECCARCVTTTTTTTVTCAVGDVTYPKSEDPCYECVCQDTGGVPSLSCSDVSSKCPTLNCDEQETPKGQCCPQCVTTTTTTTTTTSTTPTTTAPAQSCPETCPVLFCEVTLIPAGACCPVCA